MMNRIYENGNDRGETIEERQSARILVYIFESKLNSEMVL